MKTHIMIDLRNGIFPVIVYASDDVKEDDAVEAIYPFGWEEYNGSPRWGRFKELTEEDAIASLTKEVFRYRKVLKHLTGANDKNLYDVCYEMKPWEEDE